MNPRPKRGSEVTLQVDRLDQRGRGVGSVDGHAVIVRGGIPGQRLKARVIKRRRGRLEGALLEVLDSSPMQVEPRCPHSGTCGGCAFQELDYGAQLAALGAQVEEAFAAAGVAAQVPPVLGCEPAFGYRNKMDFTFGARRWVEAHEPEGAPRGFALGMHVPGRYDRVLDIRSCALHFEGADGLLATARQAATDLGLTPWDVNGHTGLLRHLVLRKGFGTGDIMVNLVTSEDCLDDVDRWAAVMLEEHPEITTLVQNVNTRLASVAFGERERVLYGPGMITERIGGLEFGISANSFFQTNSRQAEVLFDLVASMAGQRGDEVVWDLYCGTGALSLAAARSAKAVYGFELVDAAVTDARANATRNGIENVRFFAGDVLATVASGEGGPSEDPDLVIVDPPRVGLHPRVLDALLERSPGRIIYVSCNVHTAAPQIARLVAAGGYELEQIQPVDMFPHTPHVECVMSMRR